MKSIYLFAVTCMLATAPVGRSLAATTSGSIGDGKTSLYYEPATGEMILMPDGQPIGLFQILSASGIFTGPATLPPATFGFDVNTTQEKSWAVLPANAFNQNFSLGAISPTGVTASFLLQDLTIIVTGGLGTPNRLGDLVSISDGGVGPIPRPVNLGEIAPRQPVTAQLIASINPVTWSGLTLSRGSATLAHAATLSPTGVFSWDPTGSMGGTKGAGVTYSWLATATSGLSAVTGVAITLSLVPEPFTLCMLCVTIAGLSGLRCRRRKGQFAAASTMD